ncbi:quinone oxidoreductase family protein [Caldalkalibacillus uzonensis]|nr:quinone oxidoreductase [Caldalkalibacillus uzonensis]
MNAVIVTKYGGPEVLEYREIDRPTLEPTEVLIKVEAASVNFADIKARSGNYHGAEAPPFIPGLDCSGVIEEVGREVTQLRPGQRVMAFPSTGSYAEYVKAKEVLTYPIPDNVDFETAAAFPTVAITSYNLLVKMARIQAGESVLIHSASGGVGTTATQLAKLLGAGLVIGTVSSDERMEAAIKAGADHVINYREHDFVQKVNELTDGQGADIILDSLAGDMFEKSMDCLARFGRIVNFGNANGNVGGRFQTNGLHASCRSVMGYSTGTYRKYRPEELREPAQNVLKFLEQGQLHMYINKRFHLKDAAEAQRLIEARQNTGKVILLPKA